MTFVYSFKGYKLSYTKKAEKDLKAIDNQHSKKIEKKFKDMVQGLSNNDIKKLQGYNIFRLRVGNYRALFEVHEKIITILVVSVEHRKDVYEGL
ncbi:type II toxin-antitoxin system RelE/ParE family toxin [Candidatus Dependentiae bacterium]|nr:type II toxin-antitoxin system RelE/ParE family toxin [Candidatus Dependentiae bacterium]